MSSPELEKLAEHLPENASYRWKKEELGSIGLLTQATITLFRLSQGDGKAENDLDKLIGLEKGLVDPIEHGSATILSEINKFITEGKIQIREVDGRLIVKDPKEDTQELMKIKVAEVYAKKKKDKEEATREKRKKRRS